jgi:hypothetical protein
VTIKKLNDEKILKICKSKICTPPILELRKTEFFLSLSFVFNRVRDFYSICTLFKVERRGLRLNGGPRGTLTPARLALDVWSDRNPPPHDRLLPLGKALAVGLAETRPFLEPFLRRS